MKKLFVVSTPYQCLVAISIALSIKADADSDIILLRLFDVDDSLIDNMRTIFSNVYVSADYNVKYKKKIMQQIVFTMSVKDIVRKCSYNKYSGIYTSNDNLFFNQYIVARIKKNNHLIEYVHFEDGAFEYKNTDGTGFSWLTWSLKELKWSTMLGTKLKHFTFIDNSIKKAYLTFPEYARKELRRLELYRIPKNFFIDAINTMYTSVCIKENVVLCLDNSECGDYVVDINRCICDYLLNIQDRIAVKYHPREINRYIESNYVTIIDQSLPFESIQNTFNGIVISNMSSVLHTIKYMKPTSVVICTYLIFNNKEEEYVDFLQKIGVLFPKSFEELKILLESKIN